MCIQRKINIFFIIHGISIKFTLQETKSQPCQCSAFSIHRKALTEIVLLQFECIFFFWGWWIPLDFKAERSSVFHGKVLRDQYFLSNSKSKCSCVQWHVGMGNSCKAVTDVRMLMWLLSLFSSFSQSYQMDEEFWMHGSRLCCINFLWMETLDQWVGIYGIPGNEHGQLLKWTSCVVSQR